MHLNDTRAWWTCLRTWDLRFCRVVYNSWSNTIDSYYDWTASRPLLRSVWQRSQCRQVVRRFHHIAPCSAVFILFILQILQILHILHSLYILNILNIFDMAGSEEVSPLCPMASCLSFTTVHRNHNYLTDFHHRLYDSSVFNESRSPIIVNWRFSRSLPSHHELHLQFRRPWVQTTFVVQPPSCEWYSSTFFFTWTEW